MIDRIYSTAEAMQMANCTERQMQWWAERGYVTVPIIGRRRQWNKQAVIRAHVLASLPAGRTWYRCCAKLKDEIFAKRYLLFECTGPVGFVLASDDLDSIVSAALNAGPVVVVEVLQ